MVCVWVVQQDKSRNKYTVKLPHTGKPNDVIAETIRRRSRNMGRTKEETERCIEGFCHTYVLKVCGCDQFLFEGFPISQYKVSVLSFSLILSAKTLDEIFWWGHESVNCYVNS